MKIVHLHSGENADEDDTDTICHISRFQTLLRLWGSHAHLLVLGQMVSLLPAKMVGMFL
jgi:hypothetical protein